MPLNKVTADSIADGTVIAADIANGAVTGPKLGLTAINANNIVSGAVTGDKIGVGQITSNLFAAGAVSTSNISSGTSNVSVTSTNGNVTIGTAGSERVRITSAGNVGVGTTNPECKFEVGGLIRATSLTNPTFGSGVELGYDGTQGVLQAFSDRATNTSAPVNIVGDLKMNSGYGSSAIAYGCRAWVNFNGTGTPAIRASGNVSSITDNGSGDYTVNFTNAMPDTNYSISGAARYGDSAGATMRVVTIASINSLATDMTTSSIRILSAYVNGNQDDNQVVCMQVFR